MTTLSDTPGEGLADLLQRIKAFHDRDEGCNGFTADYEILHREIDEAVAGLRSPPSPAPQPALSAQGEAAQPAAEGWRTMVCELIAAWEALPGGGQQSVWDVERWLANDMKPAIDKARAMITASPNAASQDGGRDQ